MGLAISVGTLADFLQNDPEGAEWFEGDFEIVNAVLAAAGLPPHVEPRELPPLDSRASLDEVSVFVHPLPAPRLCALRGVARLDGDAGGRR